MPRIRFTTTPKLPRDLAHLGYERGTEVDLSEDQANRWLRRGVAVVIAGEPPPPPAADAPAPAGVVDIPVDWHDRHHMTRMALAREILGAQPANLAAADAAIVAEMERRAAPPIQTQV